MLDSLSMSDVLPATAATYRSLPLSARDRFIGADVAKRMFIAKAAPAWKVETLMQELIKEVVQEIVLETVADVRTDERDTAMTMQQSRQVENRAHELRVV